WARAGMPSPTATIATASALMRLLLNRMRRASLRTGCANARAGVDPASRGQGDAALRSPNMPQGASADASRLYLVRRGRGNLRSVRIATWNVNSLKARFDKVAWWLERG